MAQVILAFGSNVGTPRDAIESALGLLSEFVSDLQPSSLYRSEPMYVTDQPDFMNAAAIGQVTIGPWPLLLRLKEIERELGRMRRAVNGPREIDIDLISYGVLEYRFLVGSQVRLQIPHRAVQERRFVLEPLCEICPECRIPGKGKVIDLLAQTEVQSQGVVKEGHELLSIRSKR